jgi:hypothetical protein
LIKRGRDADNGFEVSYRHALQLQSGLPVVWAFGGGTDVQPSLKHQRLRARIALTSHRFILLSSLSLATMAFRLATMAACSSLQLGKPAMTLTSLGAASKMFSGSKPWISSGV